MRAHKGWGLRTSCRRFFTRTKEVGTHLLFLQMCAFGNLYWMVLVVPFVVVIKALVWGQNFLGIKPSRIQLISAPESIRATECLMIFFVLSVIGVYHFWKVYLVSVFAVGFVSSRLDSWYDFNWFFKVLFHFLSQLSPFGEYWLWLALYE